MTHSKADATPCRKCRIYTLIQTNASCDFLEKSTELGQTCQVGTERINIPVALLSDLVALR